MEWLLDELFFLIGAVAILLSIVLATVGMKRLKSQFWDGKTALGRLKGIVLAVGIFSVFVFGAGYTKKAIAYETKKEIKYFDYAYIYLGADYTKKRSPMCEKNDIDERFTSNLGGVLNLVSYDSLRLDGTITHHSCITGTDDAQYDAIGIQLKYYLW